MRAYDWDGRGYAAVIVQRGDGCKSTLGCGVNVWALNGETLSDALVDLRRQLDDMGGLKAGGEYEVRRAYVVTPAQLAPVAVWIADANDARLRDETAAREASERAQYERLRAKFGK